jgi:hypothetical protein
MLVKGTVETMRAVSGEFREGKKKGQTWRFLSLEVKDGTIGEICSCQLRHDDPAYKEYVGVKKVDKGEELTILKDLTGHVIKATVKKFSSGERSILQQVVKKEQKEGEKKIGYEPIPVVTVRFQIASIHDLGLPKMDDE